ncbi:MAG: hypothetical protein H6622_13255 [Halobacteriovoraceae bacterium]|nr:hypothetical protein [Halobacteriovoraceae bacterium]
MSMAKRVIWDKTPDEIAFELSKSDFVKKSRRIILAGPFCAGKTVVGKELAAILKIPFFDLDNCFNPLKESTSDIRDRETKALNTFLKTHQKNPYILALGGGTLLRAENIDSVKKSSMDIMIFLNPPEGKIFSNLGIGDNLKARQFLPQFPWTPVIASKVIEMLSDRKSSLSNFVHFRKCLVVS